MTVRGLRIEAIVFDLVLAGFAGLIVITALGLSAGSRAVPLVVRVPTLVGLLILLWRDVTARVDAVAEPPAETAPLLGQAPATAGLEDLLEAAAVEDAIDDEIPSTPEARRKQLVFALWAAAYVVGTLGVNGLRQPGLLVTTPIALFAVLLFATRAVVATLVITAVACAAMYLVFVVMLNVPF